MADIVLETSDECIFCGSKELPRSKEHLIAASFAGNLVVEAASCARCAKITGALEGRVARRTYHVGRAYYGLPSRRPQDYPRNVSVELSYGKYGPKKTVDVPVAHAPIAVLLPLFERQHQLEGDGHIRSLNKLGSHTLDQHDVQRKVNFLTAKYRARSASFHTLPVKVGDWDFERALWKIACGFFWLTERTSLLASDARAFALGDKPPTEKHENNFVSLDLYSFSRTGTDPAPASAAVFTLAEETHQFIYCEINVYAKLGLPLYRVRIPNLSGSAIERREFGGATE